MNEKIRALAGQSGFDVTHHKWIFCNDNVGEGECHELLERFARLIVKECAEIANDHNSEVEGVTLGVGRALKQHFGVAE